MPGLKVRNIMKVCQDGESLEFGLAVLHGSRNGSPIWKAVENAQSDEVQYTRWNDPA